MSEPANIGPVPIPPPRPAPLPPPPPRAPLFGCAFAASFLFNIAALFLICLGGFALLAKAGRFGDSGSTVLIEQAVSGPASATDKVAIIHLDGVIFEGALSYVHKQIDQAAQDDSVKAVVLRINSPGGSITASDDLHRRLADLRAGSPKKSTKPKPLIASLGSMAASGGYYVAMPAELVFAERSTLTGSIGVYASLPNVSALGETYGFRMTIIKAGAIKDSGSPFKEMSLEERRVWQDMVDDAYLQFLQVIEKSRPALTKAKLLERFSVTPLRPDPKASPNQPATPYERYRADGGIFTAVQAEKYGLIDKLSHLDDAIAAAATAAQLADDGYRVIKYQRNKTFAELLVGAQAPPPPAGNAQLPAQLQAALAPRLWYLSPGHEAAVRLSAAAVE